MQIRRMKQEGFTLLEVIIAVLVIGILATLSMPSFDNMRVRAKLTEMVMLMQQIEHALDLYALEYNWKAFPYAPSSISEMGEILNADMPADTDFIRFAYGMHFQQGGIMDLVEIDIYCKEPTEQQICVRLYFNEETSNQYDRAPVWGIYDTPYRDMLIRVLRNANVVLTD